jgi:ABC-type antimicrobial peptide transport system permease subunit
VDPALALFEVRTIEQATASLLASERLATFLTAFFAAVAALLCALGIYGVVSRELAARTREAAIRLALGGEFAGVVWRLARRPVRAVTVGLGAGAMLLSRIAPAMQPLLSGSEERGPAWLLLAVLALATVAAVAIAIPALRARRVEPAAVLRQE